LRRRRSVARRLALVLAVLLAVAALVVNAPGVVALWYRARYTPVVAALPEAPAYGPADRLLVLSPHPDDDMLCCAGSVRRALEAGASAFIVYFTSGDGFELDAVLLERAARTLPAESLALARRRMGEARAAARALGVPEGNLAFLGYPDGGLHHLFLENYTVPFRSRYTGLTAVPYEAALSPGAAYTGANLERDLSAVLRRVRPTRVLAPSPLDAHPDHQAVGGFALRLLGASGEAGKLRFWIVHGGLEWPLPKGRHPNLPLAPPPRGQGLPWERVSLGAEDVRRKREAIGAHGSQTLVIGHFMLAFDRENELLSPLPLPDPTAAR
jgi:LmbE family N-acetylglucosaminyl deacetylase